ncbi:uncharacterized protein [Centruroides vittatus]|uniref:uncharacterized protein isoform X2 n=1 Tax=Centruroides vittatus TaxID=120091 RepID=UPI00350FB7D0
MHKLVFTFVVIVIIFLESSEGRYMKIEGRDEFNLKRRNLGVQIPVLDTINGIINDFGDLILSLGNEQSMANGLPGGSLPDDERKKIEENSMTRIKGV